MGKLEIDFKSDRIFKDYGNKNCYSYKYEFTYDGMPGEFVNTCYGEHGNWYQLSVSFKTARWAVGDIQPPSKEYTSFIIGDKDFLDEVKRVFNISVPIAR